MPEPFTPGFFSKRAIRGQRRVIEGHIVIERDRVQAEVHLRLARRDEPVRVRADRFVDDRRAVGH